MVVLEDPYWPGLSVVVVEAPLRSPYGGRLMARVRGLLRRGERTIVVDLEQVSSIGADGIGELVRAYNEVVEADGVLRIVRVQPWVRTLLQLVGLFGLLSGSEPEPR